MEPYRKIRDNDPKKWEELNKRFQEVLLTTIGGGPRAASRRTIKYIQMEEEVAELKSVGASATFLVTPTLIRKEASSAFT